jgi:hypothetical protein
LLLKALKPFPQATGRAAALQNTLQLGLCFLASLAVSTLIATPLLTTTCVMLATVLLAGMVTLCNAQLVVKNARLNTPLPRNHHTYQCHKA